MRVCCVNFGQFSRRIGSWCATVDRTLNPVSKGIITVGLGATLVERSIYSPINGLSFAAGLFTLASAYKIYMAKDCCPANNDNLAQAGIKLIVEAIRYILMAYFLGISIILMTVSFVAKT